MCIYIYKLVYNVLMVCILICIYIYIRISVLWVNGMYVDISYITHMSMLERPGTGHRQTEGL